MDTKNKDRRLAFWISFIFIVVSPALVMLGADAEAVKGSAYALTTLGIANYFSVPTKD